MWVWKGVRNCDILTHIFKSSITLQKIYVQCSICKGCKLRHFLVFAIPKTEWWIVWFAVTVLCQIVILSLLVICIFEIINIAVMFLIDNNYHCNNYYGNDNIVINNLIFYRYIIHLGHTSRWKQHCRESSLRSNGRSKVEVINLGTYIE